GGEKPAGVVQQVCCPGPSNQRERMPEPQPRKLSYRDAGLDLDVYEQSLAGMVPFLRRTHTPRVLDGFGGFAALFSLDYNSRLFGRDYLPPPLRPRHRGRRPQTQRAAAP